MDLFDTHVHFSTDAEYIRTLLKAAYEAKVTRIMAVGGNDELNAAAQMASDIASSSDAIGVQVFKALGYDRDSIGLDPEQLDFSSVAAIGEIGLDYHYSAETRKEQLALMAKQLEISQRLNLPVVIHTREADDDTLGILREVPTRGIIHSFTGEPNFCKKLLDLGYYISLSGIVTFRAADNVRQTAKVIPLDRLLIETDTPYLAPVPKRGNPNEPAFVAHTAKFLAEYLSVPLEQFCEVTTNNALTLLGDKVK